MYNFYSSIIAHHCLVLAYVVIAQNYFPAHLQSLRYPVIHG